MLNKQFNLLYILHIEQWKKLSFEASNHATAEFKLNKT